MKLPEDQMPARYEIIGRAPNNGGRRGRDWSGSPRPSLHAWLEKRTAIQWLGLTLLATLGVIGLFGFLVLCAAGVSKLLQ